MGRWWILGLTERGLGSRATESSSQSSDEAAATAGADPGY